MASPEMGEPCGQRARCSAIPTYNISCCRAGEHGIRLPRPYASSGLNIYYIGGNIGISNVTINYTGGSTTTDSTGRYIFPVSAGWSGTVTPSKAGYIFSPASRSYSNVMADQLTQNYTASQLFSISGNTGVGGMTLSYTTGTPQSVTSQGNGNYSLSVPIGWTGIVTPSHPCFSFSPANRGYSGLADNQTSQNFTPTFNSGAGCANVHAKIGGVNQGWFGLQSGESTRASFAGVNNGPVQIVSNNGIPLIAAERLIYKVNGVNTSFTEMMGLPNSELDNIYWLPWYNNVDSGYPAALCECERLDCDSTCLHWWRGDGRQSLHPGSRRQHPHELCGRERWSGEDRERCEHRGRRAPDLQAQWRQYSASPR